METGQEWRTGADAGLKAVKRGSWDKGLGWIVVPGASQQAVFSAAIKKPGRPGFTFLMLGLFLKNKLEIVKLRGDLTFDAARS